LKFSYDLSGGVNPEVYITTGYNFPNDINKSVLIRVEYFDGAETYYGTFTITVTTLNFEFEDIPSNRRFLITRNEEFDNAMTFVGGTPGGGSFLFVISASIDLNPNDHTFTGAPCTIIVMANFPNVVIGRGQIGTYTGSNNVFFYFGAWPLNEPAMAGGDILYGYPYKINCGGPYANFASGTANFATPLIAGTNLTVLVGPDVETAHEQYLPYTP
jgi:hypothetical protein